MNWVGTAAAVPTGKPAGSAKPTARERLVGTWTLVSLTVGEGSNPAMPYGENPRGMMMLDAEGHFMITVLRSDLPKFAARGRMAGTPDENKAIVQGTIAYFGTYTIDEATLVMTVKIEANSFPNFVGQTQTRLISFNGDDEVTYINPTPSDSGGAAKVTYRRAR
jgi:lipocalin-like protein